MNIWIESLIPSLDEGSGLPAESGGFLLSPTLTLPHTGRESCKSGSFPFEGRPGWVIMGEG